MAIPWAAIRSLGIFLGPMLLPKAIAYYRSSRTVSHSLAVQPVPPHVRLSLGLLFLLAATCIFKVLPGLASENLFVRTQSRLQIQVDVLFNRLATLRPTGLLTRHDEALRAKFVNLESRLLNFQFGPAALADCSFCSSEDPNNYFYYVLPDVLWPHLANLIAITFITSPAWAGGHGARWRNLAAITAGVMAILDVYFVGSYNYKQNSSALRLDDLDFFWSMRSRRLIALAVLNGMLACLLYLSSTNRAFVILPSSAERIDTATRGLMAVKSKMSAMGIVKNTALRDEHLRSRSHAYWMHESRLMGEVMEEREVVEGINDALSSRINMQIILRDAEAYSQGVLQPLQESTADRGV